MLTFKQIATNREVFFSVESNQAITLVPGFVLLRLCLSSLISDKLGFGFTTLNRPRSIHYITLHTSFYLVSYTLYIDIVPNKFTSLQFSKLP